MGLFEKKYCDVCGEKIRFLGSKKLEDGSLCKSCEGKLSPWFTDRRQSTVAGIREQLRYREQNRARADVFQANRVLGEGNRLLIDDGRGWFTVCMSGHDLKDNPDVLSFNQVKDCQVQVEHSRTEETTQDADGKTVSYDPPRYTYSYRFHLVIQVDHPWFSEMKFQINRNTVKIQTGLPIESPVQFLSPLFKRYTPDVPDTDHSPEYQAVQALGEDMRLALLRQDRPAEASAPQPGEAENIIPRIACPACAAVSLPDENGCCPYCGQRLL
ncbi:MAG: DUF4428 domain-containing protein [Clostridia bacterium]|nr:DUF4428 domain-containing protein [Clostridia bacterium]